MQKIKIELDEQIKGERIDKLISDRVENISRSYASKLTIDNLVLVDGKAVNKNYKFRGNEKIIEIDLPECKTLEVEAEDIPLDIVYEDKDLIVVNKTQGMVVHPAVGNYSSTLVNALMAHCGEELSAINGVVRPGIVHRIDKDTSGLLVVAKNNIAHEALALQLKERKATRRYYALVNGNIKEDSLTINAPIGRHSSDRKKMAVTTKNSREAVTHIRVLNRFGKYTLLECILETGRTHQIRVHLAYIGHSVVGDKVYGIKKEEFNLVGQLLHAKTIGFIHPTKGKYMEFSSELPVHFKDILDKIELKYNS